jgi:glycosyltransferase involved in cell wall biosynthesis
MPERLSVIIPALNEAASLPALLAALAAQTRRPDEVIVADAGSQDGTDELAHAQGARVVPGGRPAAGRNAGARAATGVLLLFLDADVRPQPDFIARLLSEFAREGCAIATCLLEPPGEALADRILAEATNVYLQVVQPFSPHAPGWCILVRRAIHEAIGGFDESLKLAEDHDYVQRAAQVGDFGVLSGVRLAVSMRRLEKEGLTRLAFKYLWCEMHALAGRPIYSTPFEYEFGSFEPAARESAGETAGETAGARWRRLIDVEQLREQLGRFDNPLQRLSAGSVGRLESLLRIDWLDATRDRFRLALDTNDLMILYRYLRRREALLRLNDRTLRERLARHLQTDAIRESIRLWISGR